MFLAADTQMRNKLFQEKPFACKLRGFRAAHLPPSPTEGMPAGQHNPAELSEECEVQCKFLSL